MVQAAIEWTARAPALALRRALGALIVLGGSAVALQPVLAQALTAGGPALGASAMAGAATGLGALVLLQRRLPAPAALVRFLMLAAGTMLAAALFSLGLPALAQARMPFALDVWAALAVGYAAMAMLDRQVPHQHAVPGALPRRALLLMVAGIAVHNLPEGFAVGAGFGGGDALGWRTAAGIAVQNVPEGLIVAMALWAAGLSRPLAALAALGTGLLEPLGALAGIALVGAAPAVLPVALALAAGAMVYVVLDELLPEARRHAAGAALVLPFVAGFGGMALLAA